MVEDIILTGLGIYLVCVFIFMLVKMLVAETKREGLKGFAWTLSAAGFILFAFMSGGTLGYWG